MIYEEELRTLKKDQLLKLARYYAVEKAYKMAKAELLDAILNISNIQVSEVQKSVRIRRIEESQI